MKYKNIIIFGLFLLILFSFSVNSNAAEKYGAEFYIMAEKWSGDIKVDYGIARNLGFTSASPIYLYYYVPEEALPSTKAKYSIFAVSKSEITCSTITGDNSTFIDSSGETWYEFGVFLDLYYSSPEHAYLSVKTTGTQGSFKIHQDYYYNRPAFINDYLNGTLSYDKDIDFNNEVYNENIGYLQNVGLKITGTGGNDFTLLWSVENGDYLTDDWRVQVGWMTNFQEGLFGEKKAYTNLKLISWDDELLYKTGRIAFKMSELWDMIPNASSFSHNGYFLARIIHVNNETGVFETGGWTQIYYIYDIEGQDTVTWKNVFSSSILEHNGITDYYEVTYEEDLSNGKGGYINSANGSSDNIANSIAGATEDMDLSDATEYVYNGLTSMVNDLSQFPDLVAEVAGFLPREIIIIIGVSIVLVIIFRFLGR